MRKIVLFYLLVITSNMYSSSGQRQGSIFYSNTAMQFLKFLDPGKKEDEYISLAIPNPTYSWFSSGKTYSDSRMNHLFEAEYARKISNKSILTFRYSTPFFLNTGYPDSNLPYGFPSGRALSIKDFGAGFAYGLNSKYTIGIGLDFEHGRLKLDNKLNTIQYNLLDGDSTGYNLSFLINSPWKGAFIGASYYSPVTFKLKGSSRVGTTNTSINSELTAPSSFKIDLIQFLSPQNILFINWQKTNWSVLQKIKINNAATTGTITQNLNYKNTDSIEFGLIHNQNDWRFICGLSRDNSPSSMAERTPNSLDPANFWSAGVDFSKLIGPGKRFGIAYGRMLTNRQHKVENLAYNGSIDISADQVKIYFVREI